MPLVNNYGSRGAFWGSDNPLLPASDTGGPQVIANHGGPAPGDPGYVAPGLGQPGYDPLAKTGQTYPGVGTSPHSANIYDPLGTGYGSFAPSATLVDSGGGNSTNQLGDNTGYSSPNSLLYNPYKGPQVQGTQGPFQLDTKDQIPEQSGGGGGFTYVSPADKVGDALFGYNYGGNMFGHPRSMFNKL
jgi:hypothetical protein